MYQIQRKPFSIQQTQRWINSRITWRVDGIYVLVNMGDSPTDATVARVGRYHTLNQECQPGQRIMSVHAFMTFANITTLEASEC